MPPLTIIRESDGEWTTVDRVLAVAHTIATDLRCSGCGQPKGEAWNPDSEGWYEVKEAECQACAAVARDLDSHKEHRHERKVWVADTRPQDVKLRQWKPE